MRRSECKGRGSRFLTALSVVAVMFVVAGSVGGCVARMTRFGQIRGLLNRSTRGRLVAQYLGIPYALPPVEDLRFRSPQPWNRTWTEPFDAIESGPMCLQWDNDIILGNEDCLYLNVHVPVEQIPEKEETNISLPVIFYIHGGMFSRGNGGIRKLPPYYLMDQNVILVTVNYRLNILGFLSTGTEASPGNYGLKDVIVALRWVQDNIRSFNGDPGNVTLWGHSSGAMLVHLLAMSNRAEGLFNRYIVQGGSALGSEATSRRARNVALLAAARVNCLPRKIEPADTRVDDTERETDGKTEKGDERSGTDKNKSEDKVTENEIQRGDINKGNETQAGQNANGTEAIPDEENLIVQPEVDYENKYTAEEEEDMMWCLRHVDAIDLISVAKDLRLKADACCVFAPVIEEESNDDAVVTMHPVKAIKERRFRDLPFIIGVTEHEGLSRTSDIVAGNDTLINWLLSDFENNLPYMLNFFDLSFNTTTFIKAIEDFYFSGNISYSSLKENITMLQTDAQYIWPVYMTLKYSSEYMNSSIYVYLFSYEGTFTSTFKTGSLKHYGVSHIDDLNYLIPVLNKKYESYMLHNTENDVTMINIMTEMWASFAAKGVPEAWSIPEWPDWHESNEFLRFGNGKQPEVTVEKDFFSERMSFWEELSKHIDFEPTEVQFLMVPTTEGPSDNSDIRTHNKALLCALATLIICFL